MGAQCVRLKSFEEVIGLYEGYDLAGQELVVTFSIHDSHVKIVLPLDSVDLSSMQTELNGIEIGERIGILRIDKHKTKLRRFRGIRKGDKYMSRKLR